MRIREPKTTALIFASGKMVCTGAKSEQQSKLAARKYARIIQKLGFPAKFKDFKIQNIVGSCDVKFPIRLEGLAYSHGAFSSYEPELFPGLIYRMKQPKIVLLIFVSGKIVLTGAKVRDETYTAFENIYPVLTEFRKVQQCLAHQVFKPPAQSTPPLAKPSRNPSVAPAPPRPPRPLVAPSRKPSAAVRPRVAAPRPRAVPPRPPTARAARSHATSSLRHPRETLASRPRRRAPRAPSSPPRESLAPPCDRVSPPRALGPCPPAPPDGACDPQPRYLLLRLARSEHLLPRLLPRPATSPPSSTLPAPNTVEWRVQFAPSPPQSDRRRVERLSLRRSRSITRRRSAQDVITATLTTSRTATRFPRKTRHRRHHAQLPTISITLFQPSPTAAHITPPTAKRLNRGCSKLHQIPDLKCYVSIKFCPDCAKS
ncbi:hypothetical protein GUJ93_ZPchr0003g18030 [Zizania palustris]|nr:hypothetical protein GUJ93_ZPchr0003g18030 [Zizania palustris]